jgi:hypothetical protein
VYALRQLTALEGQTEGAGLAGAVRGRRVGYARDAEARERAPDVGEGRWVVVAESLA